MKISFIQSIAACSVLLATQAWSGSGSTTNDLMNLLSNKKASHDAPSEINASCDAVEDIVTAPSGASKHWLVFNDVNLLAEPFKFSKTLARIIDSANSNTNTSNVELVASLVDTLSLTSATNPESISGTNFEVPVNPRALESQMSPQAIVDEWFPVGVFNRFDTAPADGSHCGEYRIVYANPGRNASDPSLQTGAGRFFTIFESALPNPRPEQGIEGCTSVANFWVSLASSDLTDVERVTMLEEFFYQGLSTQGADGSPVTLAPVVDFAHYNAPLGQVRTNQFLDFRWQLREFRTAVSSTDQVNFEVETVKDNALTEFYDQQAPFNLETSGPVSNINLFNTLRSDFQTTFITDLLPQLISNDATAATSRALINQIGMSVPNRFNEFQSDAQDSSDNINRNTGISLRNNITNTLTNLGSNITQQQLLARAEATSCGGCHQFSNGTSIGTDSTGQSINWPNSAGFVHITEQGNLSPALTDVFLPQREEVLTNFVCEHVSQPKPPTSALENGVTISGITGTAAEEVRFTLEVPEQASGLQFIITGGSGDADLYVKFETPPTEVQSSVPATALECVPFIGGNSETCTMTSAQAGTYHVMVRGFSNFSDVSLTGLFVEAPITSNILENGVAKSELTGTTTEELRFTLEVPEGATGLEFSINGGSGDADLYVKFETPPTQVQAAVPATSLECVPFRGGNVETCTMPSAQNGTYHVMVRGFADFSAVNLTGSFTIP
ncbi:PPC domain-containing protein [Colwellia psychrerythraea]|uniref:Peptidase domain protein n=1 Tax=Colwellia psychrerythraea TaxID=28229 RepID=A0A099KP81_COLPS|nr:PPC domain-containing protein [Colwellia psychrerythraea]KGJ92306.1 peptidase domain protein [Colwellia psychrerythraea]